MLKNTRLDLVKNQPIENIPNHHLIYSDTILLDDACSPPTIVITISSRPAGQK